MVSGLRGGGSHIRAVAAHSLNAYTDDLGRSISPCLMVPCVMGGADWEY